jgi:hypothetical protein
MVSSLRLTLSLQPDPLRDLPQSLNREQRWFGGGEIGINWPGVVGQTRCDGSVIAVGHVDNEVRIGSSADANDLHSLPMQWVMGMGDGYPFQSWFGKGGSVL